MANRHGDDTLTSVVIKISNIRGVSFVFNFYFENMLLLITFFGRSRHMH